MKTKKLEQEGILAHSENSTKIRLCPKCHSNLRIDTKIFRVYCSSCGYVEPCHLRNLTINKTNCSSCPYSPRYRENLALKIVKREYFAKRKNQYDVLPLGIVKTLAQENLDFPKLKGKCYQAWTPKRTLKITEIQ
jgi:predicted metal-binding transcription factor (methanogenesis marker protein 9)